MNKIIKYDIKQDVKIRKYNIDKQKLKNILIIHKKQSKLSNKEIAEKLNLNISTIEHYFRKDNCFSIPSADIWEELKQILNIKTTEFDNGITNFTTKECNYDKTNRVYDENGIICTLTTDNNILILTRLNRE